MSVNVYIKENVKKIAEKEKNVLVAPSIPDDKLNNAVKAFKCEDFIESILAIYDDSMFNNAKNGLVFTGERVIHNSYGTFVYSDVESVEHIVNVTVNDKGKENTDEFIVIKTKDGKEHKIKQDLKYANKKNLAEFLNTIITDFTDFKEENQLTTISEMSEDLKIAYLKIIVNMTYIDDEQIDEKELSEILLLMTRLELSQDSRFKVRSYISEISKDIKSIEELIIEAKENSESSNFKSLMISLVKDLINTYFSTQNLYEIKIITEKIKSIKVLDKKGKKVPIDIEKARTIMQEIDFVFLVENKSLFNLDDEEIFLAYATIANDYSLVYDDLDDNAIKENAKELAAKAAAAGTPLAAVYISGSVVGMSAAGITSGLATLGMGLGMTGGLVVVGLVGIAAYKGLKHLTGANELDKHKTRVLMLQEVIKQTQKTISLIIGDINFIIQKLNDVTLEHAKQDEKIKKLITMVAQYQGAVKAVDKKNNSYQNSVNKLHCPKELDVARLKSLTSEPTKKPLFDFIIENYEEKSIEVDGKEKNYTILTENIDTEILDKMGEVFKSLGYFDMGNIVGSKVSSVGNIIGSKTKGLFG